MRYFKYASSEKVTRSKPLSLRAASLSAEYAARKSSSDLSNFSETLSWDKTCFGNVWLPLKKYGKQTAWKLAPDTICIESNASNKCQTNGLQTSKANGFSPTGNRQLASPVIWLHRQWTFLRHLNKKGSCFVSRLTMQGSGHKKSLVLSVSPDTKSRRRKNTLSTRPLRKREKMRKKKSGLTRLADGTRLGVTLHWPWETGRGTLRTVGVIDDRQCSSYAPNSRTLS